MYTKILRRQYIDNRIHSYILTLPSYIKDILYSFISKNSIMVNFIKICSSNNPKYLV